jgi:predicted permease
VATRLPKLLRNLLFRHRVERDLDDELRAYLEMAAEEKQRAGLSEDDARRVAVREAGGLDQVKENVRDVWAGATLDTVRQDVVYGARLLAKNRGFTVVAVATLALGIGVNTAVFSLVDAVVFRPLPYREPDRLVKICTRTAKSCADDVSLPELEQIRAQQTVFESVAADDYADFAVVDSTGAPQPMDAARVTASWLATLGTPPILGRTFEEGEAEAGRDAVAILTHEAWQRRFRGARDIVGRSLATKTGPVTVIGVLAPNVLRYEADVLRPLVESQYPAEWAHRDLDVFARLKPGVTLAQARAEIDVIGARIDALRGGTPRGLRLEPLGKYYAFLSTEPRKADQTLLLLLGAVGLVSFIACANVAGLLLTRAVARHRECVIRSALGASRGRLLRQLVLESLLLFLLGGAAGLVVALASARGIAALAQAGGYLPGNMEVPLDGRMLAFALLLSLAAGLVFGIVPAFRASRVQLSEALHDASARAGGGRRRRRAGRFLVATELATALVLLVGFGLLLRTLHLLYVVPPGFDLSRMAVTVTEASGADLETRLAFWRDARERARILADVEAVAVTSRPPLHGARSVGVARDGHPLPVEGQAPLADDVFVDPGYFKTMKIAVTQGRPFREEDDRSAPHVAIVSESLARREWGRQDPIGQRLVVERSPRSCCVGEVGGGTWEVVGVVADVRQGSLAEPLAATLYRPYSQIIEHDMFLVTRARSSEGLARLAAALPAHLGGHWTRLDDMRRIARESAALRLRRFAFILLGLFAVVAIVLAGVGVYAIMAHAVADRTREIGIRIALGATRPALVREVLVDAGGVAAVGVGLGSAAALAASRLLSSLLFGVTGQDVPTYIGVSAVLAAVTLLAAYVPARRATRVDPILALRRD